jgi:hypothetical protein
VIIDVGQDETGWTITAHGLGSPYPYTARLRRCTLLHSSRGGKYTCNGKHDREVATFIRRLRKTYEPSERLFR